MKFTELHKKRYFQPILFALLIHAAIIVVAMFIRFSESAVLPKQEALRFNVKSVDPRPLLVKRTSSAANPDRLKNSLRFFKTGPQGTASLPKDVPVDSLVTKESSSLQNKSEVTPKHVELESSGFSENEDMNAILIHAEEKQLNEKVQVQQKSTSGFSEMMKMVEQHKTDAGRLIQSLRKPLENVSFGMRQNVSIDPDEGMPGFTPMEGTLGNSTFDQGGTGESQGDILKYESLDNFLDIQVFTYEDPSGPGGKYFMIKIFAKKDVKQFKIMPKEILFTVDCSLSISPDRLDEFKRGISYCLKNLNKDDLFNIVAFKDKASFFSEKSISANPETIKQAERFVSELTSNRTTDVYGAFKKIVQTSPARNPSNIILISDGRPTHGVVNSRELINSITRLNKKVRPVFAYSGGAKVNRYLLDFISYQNRAWSQFIKDRGQIRKGLGDFYLKIKDPIFLNLRYQLNGLDEKEVFPKSLPDFYRNAEFTLYGKYESENDFSMQLLGDVDDKTKELVFSRSLDDAPKGGVDIMKGYAFNKIYYLISRITKGGHNAELLKQIQELSQKYQVTTPYSPELAEVD